MPLTKPNQELRRDLKEAAALLKWSGVDIKQVTAPLSEAGLEGSARILVKIALFQEPRTSWRGMRKRRRWRELCVGRLSRW